MDIVGYHIVRDKLYTSDGQILCSNVDDMLSFMIQDTKSRIGVFYHLDYSVAQLLMNLDYSKLRKLFEVGSLYAAPWHIKYISKKFLNIQYSSGRTAPFTVITDMYQYHHNSDMTENEPMYYAQEAAKIGKHVYDTLVELGLNPASLVSPIQAYDKEILSSLDLPTFKDIPDEAGEFAYNCCHGSWVEAFKKGHFEDTWDYDIRSAYGSFTATLLDTREGDWKQSKQYIEDAFYGYCKCWVNIHSNFSPIQYSKVEDVVYTPTGSWETYLTKSEIDYIEEFNLGTCEILDGYWWIPVGDYLVYPLEEMILDLYKIKEHTTDALSKKIIKRIMSGIWGKFLEKRNDGFGVHFMPAWGAEVESRTRLSVARLIHENNLYNDLLHIAVDGVLLSSPVEIEDEKSIGDWKLSSVGSAFVVGSGVCAIENKDGEGDFALTYDWMKNAINHRPTIAEYSMQKLSPITLNNAIMQDRVNSLGRYDMITKMVNIQYELKRNFPELPNCGKALLNGKYNSLPWDMSLIMSLEEQEQ